MGSDLASNLRSHMRTYTQGRRNYTRMGEGGRRKKEALFRGLRISIPFCINGGWVAGAENETAGSFRFQKWTYCRVLAASLVHGCIWSRREKPKNWNSDRPSLLLLLLLLLLVMHVFKRLWHSLILCSVSLFFSFLFFLHSWASFFLLPLPDWTFHNLRESHNLLIHQFYVTQKHRSTYFEALKLRYV